ncbi:dihydrodipicolinate reductase [Escherichia coli]|uniref:Dihydrodipicolinate reductase n=1 Tax=Escherichia coli TaxID=562 RepID=A0A377DEY7_ECOLX|nr:dihydrodipicolinate reductase [Escherichia coli]
MHDANIRVAIAGAGGRMGRQLISGGAGIRRRAAGRGAGARRIFFNWAATPVSWLEQGKQALPCKAASMR